MPFKNRKTKLEFRTYRRPTFVAQATPTKLAAPRNLAVPSGRPRFGDSRSASFATRANSLVNGPPLKEGMLEVSVANGRFHHRFCRLHADGRFDVFHTPAAINHVETISICDFRTVVTLQPAECCFAAQFSMAEQVEEPVSPTSRTEGLTLTCRSIGSASLSEWTDKIIKMVRARARARNPPIPPRAHKKKNKG